jgi:hypothetical protein
VVISDCTGNDDQLWTFKNGAVIAFGGTKCLDVTSGVNANGVKLQIADCGSNNVNQLWFWTNDNHLAWTNHSRCMDLSEGSLANGNKVQIWDCDGYVDAFIGCPVTDSCISGPAAIKVRFCASLDCCERLTLDGILVWNVGYLSNHLPHQSQIGQTGNNDCGTGSSPTSMCQTLCTSALKPLTMLLTDG